MSRAPGIRHASFLLFLLSLGFLHANPVTLPGLLNKGTLFSIEKKSGEKFQSVKAIAVVHAPVDIVWEAITDVEAYTGYMERVKKAKIISGNRTADTFTAEFEIEVPLSNTKYTL